MRGVVLAFRTEVSAIETSEGVLLEAPWARVTLVGVTLGLDAALQALASGGATQDALAAAVLAEDGAAALPRLYYLLDRCGHLRFLRYSVHAGGQSLATVVPMTAGFRLAPDGVASEARFLLSRFAYLRRDGGKLVLESPLSPARTVLAGSLGTALVAALAEPRTCGDLCSLVGLDGETARAVVALLASAGVIAETGANGALAEDSSAPLRQWDFHDLVFHARNRLGRHDYAYGGTFRFQGEIPPLPALKRGTGDGTVPLYQPSLEGLMEEDMPLTRALEARRSVREFGQAPITAEQLGEFLYRVARVRGVVPADAEGGPPYETSRRPYPSGGATYDLELYLTVNRCAGLAAGIYHYDPLAHGLQRVAEWNTDVGALLRDAQASAPWRTCPRCSSPWPLASSGCRGSTPAWPTPPP